MHASAAPVSVLLLADTHGWLDPRVAAVAARCDYAVHAGDVGAAAVLSALEPQRAVLAVRGNNDLAHKWPAADGDLLTCLPLEASLDLPGGRLVVVHGHRTGRAHGRHALLRRIYPEARAVVYGHSHLLTVDTEAEPWILNPGAAGRARTYGGPSCLLLHVSGESWRVEPLRFSPVRRPEAFALNAGAATPDGRR